MKSAALLASLVFVMLTVSACNLDSSPNNNNAASSNNYAGQHIFGTDEAALADGNASMARFSNPATVAVAPDGTVFVADYDNNAIRAILNTGLVLTVIQRDDFQRPFGLTVANDGTLYVQTDGDDMGNRDATTGTIWKIDKNTGAVTVVVRDIGRPRGLVALPDGRIAMSDLVQNVISILDPTVTPVTNTVIAGAANQSGLVDNVGTMARFNRPYGMSLASDGALLVADQNNNVIRHVTLAGVVTTFAGSIANAPAAASAGDENGPVASASFNLPEAIAVAGNAVYVSDQGNHIIRKISAGVVSTQAGNGTAGFVDAQGTSAEFYGLEGISAGPDGKLWIADGNVGDPVPYNRVRYIPIP